MYVGVGSAEFIIPGSTSLKDKRRAVKSVLTVMQAKFNVSVAEVEHMDLRQRGSIGIACVSNSAFHARKMLHEVERFMRNQYAIEVIAFRAEVVTPGDA